MRSATPVSNDPRRRPDEAPGFMSTLRAVGAALMRLAARRQVQNRLSIDGLPDGWATLAPGRLYLVYGIAGTAAADALLFESACDASARAVTLVLSARREKPLARLLTKEGARSLPARLNVLTLQPRARAADAASDTGNPANPADAEPDAARPLARLFGALRALKPFGFRRGSMFFVEGAEQWFSWDRPDDLAYEGRVLANWCQTRGITLVLLAGSVAPSTNELALDAEATEEQLEHEARDLERDEFHGSCRGVARLQHTHGELLWHVDFWRTRSALAAGEVRALRFTRAGRLIVAPQEDKADGVERARIARDEMRVIATRGVIGDEPWVPQEWEIVDDLQAALAAGLGARAASVVLDYTGSDQLEALCETVHTLRRTCGRALKIVLVERGQVLRHQFELLVLNLGANLVIGRDVPFSRMQSLMHSLRGQLNARPVAADYRAALAAALSDEVCGYLPVESFVAHVRHVLGRGQLLRLPHVLVKLRLKPELAHADALRQCRPTRNGDVVTADSAHLYVFLFACRLADAQGSLARIFRVPVESLADSTELIAREPLLEEVERLETEQRRVPNVDYSDVLDVQKAGGAARAASHGLIRSAAQNAVQAGRPGSSSSSGGSGGSPQAPSAAELAPQAPPLAEPFGTTTEGAAHASAANLSGGVTVEATQAAQAAETAETAETAAPPPRRRRAEPAAMPLRKQEAA
ncbi:cellulose biosynthesis protein BcsE [Paraburkholderia sp. MPAMCS5]|uniref:cellulose biosynthesis protein BcsE n=1 Tax=Paraburkholderia sp. MPAMCS5 TaxID=3112563 RepID=UPI002E1848B7|nr:cellulose biosynthesis protein BcsE [Paraburkholderia sp. MPAMCS5]